MPKLIEPDIAALTLERQPYRLSVLSHEPPRLSTVSSIPITQPQTRQVAFSPVGMVQRARRHPLQRSKLFDSDPGLIRQLLTVTSNLVWRTIVNGHKNPPLDAACTVRTFGRLLIRALEIVELLIIEQQLRPAHFRTGAREGLCRTHEDTRRQSIKWLEDNRRRNRSAIPRIGART